MNISARCAVLGVMALAGCAHPGGLSSNATKDTVPGSDLACQVEQSLGGLRPGGQGNASMHVLNDGRSCIWGTGLSGVSQGDRQYAEPTSHGTVDVMVRGDRVIYAYKPKPGYAGADSFRIRLRRDDGYDNTILVGVTVDGPRT